MALMKSEHLRKEMMREVDWQRDQLGLDLLQIVPTDELEDPRAARLVAEEAEARCAAVETECAEQLANTEERLAWSEEALASSAEVRCEALLEAASRERRLESLVAEQKVEAQLHYESEHRKAKSSWQRERLTLEERLRSKEMSYAYLEEQVHEGRAMIRAAEDEARQEIADARKATLQMASDKGLLAEQLEAVQFELRASRQSLRSLEEERDELRSSEESGMVESERWAKERHSWQREQGELLETWAAERGDLLNCMSVADEQQLQQEKLLKAEFGQLRLQMELMQEQHEERLAQRRFPMDLHREENEELLKTELAQLRFQIELQRENWDSERENLQNLLDLERESHVYSHHECWESERDNLQKQWALEREQLHQQIRKMAKDSADRSRKIQALQELLVEQKSHLIEDIEKEDYKIMKGRMMRAIADVHDHSG